MPVDDSEESDSMFIRKWNAILRAEYGIIPEKLPLDVWAKMVEECRYVYEIKRKNEEYNRQSLEYSIKKTLYEIANAIYGKK